MVSQLSDRSKMALGLAVFLTVLALAEWFVDSVSGNWLLWSLTMVAMLALIFWMIVQLTKAD